MIYFGCFSFFQYYSFVVEKTKSFIRSRGSLENHTRFKTIMVKIYTRFQTKTAQNHTLWGGTYLYSLYRGVPPHPSPPGFLATFIYYTRCNYIYSEKSKLETTSLSSSKSSYAADQAVIRGFRRTWQRTLKRLSIINN